MSMLSSAFKKVTGQKLSTVVGTAALTQNRTVATAAGTSGVLLLGGLAVGAYLLLKKKKG